MLRIRCSGTPRQIGLEHGAAAKRQIHSSIAFYKALFHRIAAMSWPDVHAEAVKFLPMLNEEEGWKDYVEEMGGVAEGAGVEFASVLAMNVRTEIAYGMFNDGCTALSWREHDAGLSFLAQNWDWFPEQMENVISMHIARPGKPSIHMMTEAGIIGKIGLNSSGVGVTLNAVKAKGVDFARLPCHLALRKVLESDSCEAAVHALERVGVAAACHILIADSIGSVGLECSALDIVRLGPWDHREGHKARDIITHTNHFIKPHTGPNIHFFILDSPSRLVRLNDLLDEEHGVPSFETIEKILKDEENFPWSICRGHSPDGFATLFSIVMDLTTRTAQVKVGRPTEPTECLTLEP